jgi:hypothetical protein
VRFEGRAQLRGNMQGAWTGVKELDDDATQFAGVLMSSLESNWAMSEDFLLLYAPTHPSPCPRTHARVVNQPSLGL